MNVMANVLFAVSLISCAYLSSMENRKDVVLSILAMAYYKKTLSTF
jgi:hypothetical protein